ncbi:MAG: CRTAC1 family protein [Pirellulaceae bacterium]
MTQPFDHTHEAKNLRTLDKEKGEFWVGNPWLFPKSGENLSAFERNGIYLNGGDQVFHDMSFLSGADSNGDGRCVVATDLNGDGMVELLVRQAGGGPLLIYENQFPMQSWLKLSFKGTKSNATGVGVKVACTIGDRVIRRENYPIVNFLSQKPAVVELGLGNAEVIETLEIRWPSGHVQVFSDVNINQHLIIEEAIEETTARVSGTGL